MLNVIEGNNGRPKISNVMKMKEGDSIIDQCGNSLIFNIDEYQKGKTEVFNQLSEGIRNIILKSQELQHQDINDIGTSDMNSDDQVPF